SHAFFLSFFCWFGSHTWFSVMKYSSTTQLYSHLQVGVVSDYDLLALDSMAGCGLADTNSNMFPEVDSTWKTFREIQRLLSKTSGKVIGDVMTPSPLVVRETTNLDAAARLLLETKYHRLPVVDSAGKLVLG
uniref:CBS domain-containing protein n=1 Tax=Aegilops tauschii subsp. strangulata TaxID=200361 RepID=A0A453KGE0_AEGTS